MDITNSIRKYAECISSGAITEPTGGSWISAIAIWQGSTEPLNASWLQRHCDNLGITQPVNGSWLIALALYWGQVVPVNGSWSYAIQLGCEAGPPAPTELIWNETSTEWQLEESAWALMDAPMQPILDQDGDTFSGPVTLSGTSDPLNIILVDINGYSYEIQADALGAWTTASIVVPGDVAPGIQYTVTIVAKDMSNGLISAETQGTIFVIATEKLISFLVNMQWSLGWVYSWIEVQSETSPGVWTSIEYEGNPYWCTDASCNDPIPAGYYKTDGGPYGATPGIYGMNIYQNDPAGFTAARNVLLTPGTPYRIIGKTINDGNSYGSYTSYSVNDGATEILPLFVGANSDYTSSGTVQQTFIF